MIVNQTVGDARAALGENVEALKSLESAHAIAVSIQKQKAATQIAAKIEQLKGRVR